jgi:hypothetical protein
MFLLCGEGGGPPCGGALSPVDYGARGAAAFDLDHSHFASLTYAAVSGLVRMAEAA